MAIDINENSLKQGVLGLVLALTEVIRDALRIQAFKRMEGSSLTEEEVERLGGALMDLDTAIDKIKEEQGLTEAVQSVRDGLDSIVDDVIDKMVNPEKWDEEVGNVLGLFLDEPDYYFQKDRERKVRKLGLDAKEIECLIEERWVARAARDWEKADEIRRLLAEKGVSLKDTHAGTSWEIE